LIQALSLSLDGGDERSNFPSVAQGCGLFEKGAAGFALFPKPFLAGLLFGFCAALAQFLFGLGSTFEPPLVGLLNGSSILDLRLDDQPDDYLGHLLVERPTICFGPHHPGRVFAGATDAERERVDLAGPDAPLPVPVGLRGGMIHLEADRLAADRH
jgi:hypothetical protein